MERLLLRFTIVSIAIITGVLVLSDSSGPYQDATGGPYDTNQDGCTQSGCHYSYALNSGTGSITINGPSSFYPGESYTITVTVAQSSPPPGRYGFQCIALKSSNNAVAGNFTLGTGTKLQTISGRQYIEHNSTLNTSGSWTFTWNSPNDASQVTFYAGGLAANYNSNSTGDYAYTSSLVINPIQPITISRDSTETSCFGACDGGASFSVTGGGVAPYTYQWSSGETGTSISNKCGGTYTVTITDDDGHEEEFELEVPEPDDIKPNFKIFPSSCAFGSGQIAVVPTGGHGGYSYMWNDSAGTTDSVIYDAGVGLFTVTITDSEGCSVVKTGNVFSSSSGLEAEMISVAENCKQMDGIAVVNMILGNEPYTYAWSGGGSNDTLSGLVPGTYTVSVTDSLGCFDKFSVVVDTSDVNIDEDSTQLVHNMCYHGDKGEIHLAMDSGIAPFTYYWIHDTTLNSQTDSVINLTGGTYKVIVIDSPGCRDTATFEILRPDSVYAEIIADSANEGFCDGTVVIKIHGGTPPFTISWPSSFNIVDDTARNACGGEYFSYATDTNGCLFPFTFSVPTKLGISSHTLNEIRIFPNPTDGKLNIGLPTNSSYRVEVFDVQGKLVLVDSPTTGHIDLSGLSNGVYHLKLSSSESSLVKKVMIQKETTP